MKRILLALVVFVISVHIVHASDLNKDYSILFDKNRYHLLYSVKNPDFGGYLNEYYKKGETYNIWSEMVAVHHFPNAYSPIDRIKDFKDYLSSMQVPSSLTFDDKKNSALIDFVVITNNQMPVVLEFNIFKYEKSKKCGSVALQYVKRYSATTTMQIEDIKKDFAKNRKRMIKIVKSRKIPSVITVDIDKCISGIDVNSHINSDNGSKQSEEVVENSEKIEQVIDNDNVSEENSEMSESGSITVNNYTENNAEDVKPQLEQENISLNQIIVNVENIDTSETQNIADNLDNKDLSITEEQKYNDEEEKKQVLEAPVPTKIDSVVVENNNVKNLNYIVSNNKEDFVAKPRTKKELREYIKKQKALQKLKHKSYTVSNNKEFYIAESRTKKELKANRKTKKLARKRAKRAKQMLSE